MGKIIGLGGLFLKAKDPQALAQWYQQNLGIHFNGNTYVDFPLKTDDAKQAAGSNVLSFFKEETDYFSPSSKAVMINFRVEDLAAFLEELSEKGIAVVGDVVNEAYGKFAWIMDIEGNKIELWEPPAV